KEAMASTNGARYFVIDFDDGPGRRADVRHERRTVSKAQVGITLSIIRGTGYADAGVLRGDGTLAHSDLAGSVHLDADTAWCEVALQKVGDSAPEHECQSSGPVMARTNPGRRECAFFDGHAIEAIYRQAGLAGTGLRFPPLHHETNLPDEGLP